MRTRRTPWAVVAAWAGPVASLAALLLLPQSVLWLLLAVPAWAVTFGGALRGWYLGAGLRLPMALAAGLAMALWALPLTLHEVRAAEPVYVQGRLGGWQRTLAGFPWHGVYGYTAGMGADRVPFGDGALALLANWGLLTLLCALLLGRSSHAAAARLWPYVCLLAGAGVLAGGWTLVLMFD